MTCDYQIVASAKPAVPENPRLLGVQDARLLAVTEGDYRQYFQYFEVQPRGRESQHTHAGIVKAARLVLRSHHPAEAFSFDSPFRVCRFGCFLEHLSHRRRIVPVLHIA